MSEKSKVTIADDTIDEQTKMRMVLARGNSCDDEDKYDSFTEEKKSKVYPTLAPKKRESHEKFLKRARKLDKKRRKAVDETIRNDGIGKRTQKAINKADFIRKDFFAISASLCYLVALIIFIFPVFEGVSHFTGIIAIVGGGLGLISRRSRNFKEIAIIHIVAIIVGIVTYTVFGRDNLDLILEGLSLLL